MDSISATEEYISKLEDRAGRDMYDPCKFSLAQNMEYLDNLILSAREKANQKQYDEAYIGFRRFQIVLSIVQQHGLFSEDDQQIMKYNEVFLRFFVLL